MTAVASESSAVGYALWRLREIVTELDGLHSMLQGEGGGHGMAFGHNAEKKPRKVAGFRDWLKLKSNRAAMILLVLADTPGEIVAFETLLSALDIYISKQDGVSANRRKLVHVYMCDLRRGLAAAGFDDAIYSRSKLGYVLSAPSARSILKAFSHQEIT